MAKFKSEELLNELQEDVRRIKAAAEHISGADSRKLIYQTHPEKWSVVQVLEHMNAYGRHYIPAIDRAIAIKSAEPSVWFTPGTFGNYFTKSMKPTNVYEIKNKMKTMKAYSFPNSLNVEKVLQEFLGQQDRLIQLMDLARSRDLNSIRIPITVSKLVKLKLGDVFRFLIAHEQRHMIQARNTLHETGVSTEKFPVILEASKLQKTMA
ncbi:MAG TPA: DinB family protein [Chitinophagaceae bacterium]